MEDLSVYFREPENAAKYSQDDINRRTQHLADLYAAAAQTLQVHMREAIASPAVSVWFS